PLDFHGHGSGLGAVPAPDGGEAKLRRLAHFEIDRALGGLRVAEVHPLAVRLQLDDVGVPRSPGNRYLLTRRNRRIADLDFDTITSRGATGPSLQSSDCSGPNRVGGGPRQGDEARGPFRGPRDGPKSI